MEFNRKELENAKAKHREQQSRLLIGLSLSHNLCDYSPGAAFRQYILPGYTDSDTGLDHFEETYPSRIPKKTADEIDGVLIDWLSQKGELSELSGRLRKIAAELSESRSQYTTSAASEELFDSLIESLHQLAEKSIPDPVARQDTVALVARIRQSLHPGISTKANGPLGRG
jgi:hypothetical protein